MTRRQIGTLALTAGAVALLLVACGSSAPTATPTAAALATPTALPTATPTLDPFQAEWDALIAAAQDEGDLTLVFGGSAGRSYRPIAEFFGEKFGITALHEVIHGLNDRVYDSINNGVYRAGFATTQAAYNQAFHQLFDSLDWVEDLLSRQRYLAGEQLTEADWRLFTTLIRFDAVYFGHFKTNRQLLADYPAISGYVRELYQVPGVAQTVNFDHIKTHYYVSHSTINPTGVVPVGPQQDFTVPHNRELLKAA